ncbi:cytochrome P450 [Xylariomycetidae sp. FL0641]|nr:cytochrome P450 [Xylariomycetidae sp. FL0641]
MLLYLVATAIAGYIPWVIALLAYNLFFHPLRDYPGPFLAKITDGYAGFYAICRNLHLKTREDHLKYGPVMRYGPDRLVFNTPQAFADIYKNERVVKSEVYSAFQQRKDVYSVFNARDREIHRQKRKLIGRAVTEQSMRGFEPTMAAQIDIFLRQLLPQSSSQENPSGERAVNMSERLKRLGYDVVGHLAFGYALDTQTRARHRFWPLLRRGRLEAFLRRRPRSLHARLMRLIEAMVAARLAQPRDARRDLYFHVADELATSGGTGDNIRLGELWPEAVFFIPAGGDTTATGLAALFFYLSRHPASYRTLAAEIRGAFAAGADIAGGPRLAGCRYLRACIDEALRRSPPVPGTLWRELADEGDPGPGPWVVDGHPVPRGTLVGVNTYSLHHDAAAFPEPYAFRPERWLGGGHEAPPPTHAFAAFSAGYRGCAGKAMAYLESSLVVAKTLWYFDFEAAGGDDAASGENGEFRTQDVFISMHDGPHLLFRPREQALQDLGLERGFQRAGVHAKAHDD